MKSTFCLLLVVLILAGCTKATRPRFIEKNCCNSAETQWVVVQSSNDSAPNSYFFMPQVFAPGTEDGNNTFKSVESGVANYQMSIRLGEDVIWLYDSLPPINWDGNIANSELPAQSGVYTYDLTATFTNGKVATVKDQNFCLIREFAVCPQNFDKCVLRSMFDINDTTAPNQYINESALTSTGLYRRCD